MILLGKLLKEAREKKEISIKELAKISKIQIHYLDAIENNHFEKTPGDPYTLGYINTLIKYYDLDKELIINLYKDSVQKTKNNEIVINRIQDKNQYYYIKYFFTGFIFLLFTMFFYKFFITEAYLNNDYAITPELSEDMIALLEEQQIKEDIAIYKKNKEQKEYAKKESISINIEDNNLEKDTRKAVASINNNSLQKIKERVFLLITDDTWVQIRDSNENILISKLMRKNERFIFDSTMKYFITTGNAGNIEINLGENKFSKLGKKGEILNSYNLDLNKFGN